MLRGSCHGRRAGEAEAELLHVFKGLDRRIRSVDIAELVKVNVPGKMGISHIPGEYSMEGEFLLDAFSQREVRSLGPVRYVGVFPVPGNDQLSDIIKREAETGVHPPGLFTAPLDELRVHEFPDEGRREGSDSR